MRRARRRKPESRSEIIAAAEQRFADLGYQATRLEDVAADVGLGRSGVLYHFQDKRSLYRAVLDGLYGQELDQIKRALAGTGTLTERIERAVDVAIPFLADRPAAAKIALREAYATDSDIRQEMSRQALPLLELLRLLLEEGERSGELQPLDSDPYFLMSAIVGTLAFYLAALPSIFEDHPFDPLRADEVARLRRNLVGMIRRLVGIQAPAHPSPVPLDPAPRPR